MADRDILYDRYTYLEIEHQIYPADYLYPDDELYPASERPMHFDTIISGTLNLSEMISDGALQFGVPYANKFEVELYDSADLTNKDIKVFQKIDGIDTQIFTGRINSYKGDREGTYRKLIAYDAFYELSKKNIAEWWNAFWETRYDSQDNTYTKATLKQIRTSLLQYVGLEEADPNQVLPNETVSVGRTVAISQMSFPDMCKHIFELSGCFPNINREGKLEYIFLGTNTTDITDEYETDSSEFGDYSTQKITGVRILDSTGAVLITSGTDDNAYNITGNIFLMDFYDDYGESTMSQMGKLSNIGSTLLNTIKNITYTPSDVNMIVSLMSCKLGDKLHTELGDIYVLENEYSGIQLVDQNISCQGDEYLEQVDDAVDLNYQILGEKYIRVRQDIDEFSVELGDLAESTATRFSQTADQIQAEVTRAQASEGELRSSITQTAESIETEVERSVNNWIEESPIGTKLAIKYRGKGVPWTNDTNRSNPITDFPNAAVNDLYLNVENGYVYKIFNIYREVIETDPELVYATYVQWSGPHYYLQGSTAYFVSRISQSENSIVLSVDNDGNVVAVSLTGDRESGSTAFTVNADNIDLSGKTINLTGENIKIVSDNFNVDSDGSVKMSITSRYVDSILDDDDKEMDFPYEVIGFFNDTSELPEPSLDNHEKAAAIYAPSYAIWRDSSCTQRVAIDIKAVVNSVDEANISTLNNGDYIVVLPNSVYQLTKSGSGRLVAGTWDKTSYYAFVKEKYASYMCYYEGEGSSSNKWYLVHGVNIYSGEAEFILDDVHGIVLRSKQFSIDEEGNATFKGSLNINNKFTVDADGNLDINGKFSIDNEGNLNINDKVSIDKNGNINVNDLFIVDNKGNFSVTTSETFPINIRKDPSISAGPTTYLNPIYAKSQLPASEPILIDGQYRTYSVAVGTAGTTEAPIWNLVYRESLSEYAWYRTTLMADIDYLTLQVDSERGISLTSKEFSIDDNGATFSGELSIGSFNVDTSGNLNINNKFEIDTEGNLSINDVFEIDSNGNLSINGVFELLNTGRLVVNDYFVVEPDGSLNIGDGAFVVNTNGEAKASSFVALDRIAIQDSGDEQSSNKGYISFSTDRSTPTNPASILTLTSGALTFELNDAAGAAYIGGYEVLVNTGSDIRLKENFKDITKDYEQMYYEIKPLIFNYIGKDKKEFGLIAQDLEALLQKYHIDKNNCFITKTKDEKLGVRYGIDYCKFITYNMYMIQKQHAEIENLQNEVDTLKSQMKEVLSRIGG